MKWNIFGIIGMVLLHSASLPIIYRIAKGDYSNLPPMDYMVLLFVGLLMMTIRYHYVVKDTIAVYSNLIGVYANLIVIGAITIKGLSL